MNKTPTAIDLYKKYLALKRHFNSDNYDYFKYNGKTRVSEATFNKRPDRTQFHRLSKHPQPLAFLLANLLDDPSRWVGELFNEEASIRYNQWKSRINRLGYLFEQDLLKLDTNNFNEQFVSKNGEYPPALALHLSGQISIESLIILDDLLDFKERWDKEITDPYIWPTVSKKMVKYRPFLRYKKEEMRQKALDVISNNYINRNVDDDKVR